MTKTNEQLYAERLNRYTTAMRKGKPDMVPIRPFVAEFCGRVAIPSGQSGISGATPNGAVPVGVLP